LIGVVSCSDTQDILLSSREGKCVRFPVQDLRVFTSRLSTGMRGIKLAPQDEIISITVLNHSEATPEERAAYIRLSRQKRGMEEENDENEEIKEFSGLTLSSERFETLEAQEQFILTVTDRGFGKRTSAYEYRITNRGVQGVASIKLMPRTGKIVNSFIVNDSDHIVLVTDAGQLIRCPVKDIRMAGRQTQGVTIFRVTEGEKVVSIARIAEAQEQEQEVEEVTSDESMSGT
jgi:DNA gyrase subunit A